MMALFGMLYLFYSQGLPTAEPSYTISYSQFKSLIETGKVETVLLAGDTASGQLFDDTPWVHKVSPPAVSQPASRPSGMRACCRRWKPMAFRSRLPKKATAFWSRRC